LSVLQSCRSAVKSSHLDYLVFLVKHQASLKKTIVSLLTQNIKSSELNLGTRYEMINSLLMSLLCLLYGVSTHIREIYVIKQAHCFVDHDRASLQGTFGIALVARSHLNDSPKHSNDRF
jgi:hypothetical protein